MKIEKLYLQCLSHASYILHSDNEVAVIDPQRDVDEYLDFLNERNLTLKYILETHLHADFVSGHLELAKRSGAKIVFGKKANVQFEHISVVENDILTLGSAEIKILETPGHTPEGVCYLVRDLSEINTSLAVFTGDTLFAGDVGRPDLLDKTIPANELGGMLYDSLRNKLMTLPDDTKVYPAHGAGSSCGRALDDVEFTTIGKEKENNYALQPMSKEEFIRQVTVDQPIAPKYFLQSPALNRVGLPSLNSVLEGYHGLSINEFEKLVNNKEYQILDVRDPDIYSKGHVPGSLNIGLDGRYAEWVGSIMDENKQIVFIADIGHEQEAAIRSARVGFDNIHGYLDGGFQTWTDNNKEVNSFNRFQPEELDQHISRTPHLILLDVRRPSEYRINHLPNSTSLPLHNLQDNLDKIDKERPIVVYCEGGYRSIIATSILLQNGFKEIIDLAGGFSAYLETNQKVHLKDTVQLL